MLRNDKVAIGFYKRSFYIESCVIVVCMIFINFISYITFLKVNAFEKIIFLLSFK